MRSKDFLEKGKTGLIRREREQRAIVFAFAVREVEAIPSGKRWTTGEEEPWEEAHQVTHCSRHFGHWNRGRLEFSDEWEAHHCFTAILS